MKFNTAFLFLFDPDAYIIASFLHNESQFYGNRTQNVGY